LNITTVGLLVVGLVLLIVGAEALVRGASKLAAAFGIPPLVIGLTVVALGTSSPELAVGIKSALSGNADIALGNVVGSNIFNILVIIGLSAVVTPLVVAQRLVRWDVPLVIGLSFLVFFLGLSGSIGRVEGLLLFVGLIVYITFTIRQSRKESTAVQEEYAKEYHPERFKNLGQWAVNIGLLVGGLVMLVLGSNWLVNSASSLARAFGISELVIGLTIVAIGTSAPELATSLMAAKRGERDIAVGNAIGSNLFNILGVLGITAALAPNGIAVPRSAMAFDIPVMIAVAIAALPVFFTGYSISRLEGAVFLLYYVAYALFLLLDAVEHDLLPLYSTILFVFVIPITVLTLAILVAREVRLHRRGGSLLKPETVPVADGLLLTAADDQRPA
jgi:cation:H+ antiporter